MLITLEYHSLRRYPANKTIIYWQSWQACTHQLKTFHCNKGRFFTKFRVPTFPDFSRDISMIFPGFPANLQVFFHYFKRTVKFDWIIIYKFKRVCVLKNWFFLEYQLIFSGFLFQEFSKLDKKQKVKYLLPAKVFQVSFHFLEFLLNLTKFHDNYRFSRYTFIFPGFPGRVGTLEMSWSDNKMYHFKNIPRLKCMSTFKRNGSSVAI